MQQEKVKYSDVIAAGFIEEKADDKPFFDEYGFEYRIISYKLKKRLRVYWDVNERTLEALHTDKFGNILGKMPVKNLKHFIELVKLFKGAEAAQQLQDTIRSIKARELEVIVRKHIGDTTGKLIVSTDTTHNGEGFFPLINNDAP